MDGKYGRRGPYRQASPRRPRTALRSVRAPGRAHAGDAGTWLTLTRSSGNRNRHAVASHRPLSRPSPADPAPRRSGQAQEKIFFGLATLSHGFINLVAATSRT